MKKIWVAAMLASAALVSVPAVGQKADDSNANAIIDQGFNHSQVMQIAQEMTDGLGPRLTNSPGMRRAEQWAIDKFGTWGLANIRRDGFEFGRGWEIVSVSARMTTPRPLALTAIPIAWTPSTNGPLSAPVIVAPMTKEAHFDEWKGKLAGKIVLVTLPGDGDEPDKPAFRRLESADIAKLDELRQPKYDPDALNRRLERSRYIEKLDAFLKAEGAVAWVRQSYRDGKLVHGEGYNYRVGRSLSLPAIELAAEDYRRLARLAKSGAAPQLEIDSNVRFDDSDTKAYNIIAEIPGTDPKAGYVMAGAHFDSWVAGDGATDNAAGSAVVMEAARIIKTLGIRPKRTIRFILWTGEEQGILGSLAYVEKYLASRPGPAAGEDEAAVTSGWSNRYPITPRPGYGDLKAYFNMDNGSGKLRGLYAEGNVGAVPILTQWLAPFNALGAGKVVAAPTGGTDHVYMQSVGVPGFQFIQDPLDYSSRTHHSSADTFDHLKADDLRQASVVMAGVLVAAANSDKTLPRFPVPTQPSPYNPFKYKDPNE
jgi:carboxypeptidase Q